jgi:hypothetical protein
VLKCYQAWQRAAHRPNAAGRYWRLVRTLDRDELIDLSAIIFGTELREAP